MRRHVRISLLAVMVCCCTFAAGAGELHAQTRADSAAVLLNAAEQLRLRGETAAARALLELIARQYAGTPAAMEVEGMRLLLRRTPEAERSGRTELLVFGTSYGAWLGIAVPLALDSESAEAYGLGLLLGAPLGFIAAKRYADAKMPTEGQTRALTFGGSWGTFMGFALAEVLDLGGDTAVFCPDPGGPCFEEDNGGDAQTYVAAAVAGGLLGIATGALLARKPITAGTAAAVTLGGMWGTWFGFGIAFLADQEDDGLLTGAMIGGNAALAGLGMVAPRWQMSESRARLISVAGLAGGLAGAGLLLITQPGGDRAPLLFPLMGSAAGLTFGALWTRERDTAGDADTGDRGALINRSGGRWAVAVPDAGLRLQRAQDGHARAAAYVPLLRARF
jgi:hypothetical protein